MLLACLLDDVDGKKRKKRDEDRRIANSPEAGQKYFPK